VAILGSMAEIPEADFVERPDEVLRRIKSGEEMILTDDGGPIADVVPRRRESVTWDEFVTWPKMDRGMRRVLRDIRRDSQDWQDPWERWGADQ
jgi:antitoxin (DNA-binding transcriptional repressor) of toxin-antitoxin stability system